MTINERQNSANAIIGVSYVLPAEIDSEVKNSLSTQTITLVANKTWKPIYFTPGTAILTTQGSITSAGEITESKFEMRIPGASEGISDDLTSICGRAIVLMLTFENGSAMYCGSKNKKLRLFPSLASGTKNGYTIAFAYKDKREFYWKSKV